MGHQKITLNVYDIECVETYLVAILILIVILLLQLAMYVSSYIIGIYEVVVLSVGCLAAW
jgi:hypothetical protein